MHTIEAQAYTDLQSDKVVLATIARVRKCPIPKQLFPHKSTDKTGEGCQVSNFHIDFIIFSSQINKCLQNFVHS